MIYDYGTVTADTVTREVEAAVSRADALVADALAQPTHAFDSLLVPLELAGAEIAVGYGRGAFMAHVHPDAAVRDAGQAAEERLTKWRVGIIFRRDVYRAVAAFAESEEAEALEGERRRLLDHWMRDFRRAGHELEPAEREELEGLRSRLVELEVSFQRNIAESPEHIEVTQDELAGLSDEYVARLKPGAKPGTYQVSLEYPEVVPFMSRAHDRARREELQRKDWNQAAALNRPLLEEALGIRRRITELLGHATWADYATEVRMAGSASRVQAFYDELLPHLEGAARREIAAMTALAERDGVSDGIRTWDWAYYEDRQAREQHGVDQDEVSAYLPLDRVLDGMFELTGEVFGLDYRRVPEAHAWHPSVQLFEIHDRSSGALIAHFYADLFPREGKFTHAAAFPLLIGHRRSDGSYQTPASAIVANFTPPSAERPSLLRHGPHGEIETLFHEFGHVLHMSLSRAEFTRFSSAETEWDFVEAPSQIMEHWVWEPEILARFARHFETGEPLPADLARRMVAARFQNVGVRGTRQAFFGTMDQAMHTATTAPDLDAIMREAHRVTQLPYPEDTFMLASLGHLMGGYDAGYYGYLWAEVIGDDMWGRFAREGVASRQVGGEYRRAVLEPNGSRSGDELVESFLGRRASIDAYLALRGMDGAE